MSRHPDPVRNVRGHHTLAEVVGELARRRAADKLREYKPSERRGHNQLSFHCSDAKYRGIGGGNRAGKSKASAAEIAWRLRGDHPYQEVPRPAAGWLISAQYSTIMRGVYPYLREYLPQHTIHRIGPKLSGHEIPTFIEVYSVDRDGNPCGISRLEFQSSQGGEEARERMQSAAVDFIAIDEEIDSRLKQELLARLVDRRGVIWYSATLERSEPWFVEIERLGDSGHEDYFHVRLETDRNPYLDSREIKRWKRELSPDELEVRIKGKSRRTSLLVYPTWDSRIHVAPEWRRSPDGVVVCAIDPGLDCFAAMWVELVPSGNDTCFQCMYLRNCTGVDEAHEEIRNMEGWAVRDDGRTYYPTPATEVPVIRLVDPAEVRRTTTGKPGVIDLLLDDYKLDCVPADRATDNLEIAAARRWLEPRMNKSPGFRIWKDAPGCTDFLNEVVRYRRQRDKGASDQNAPGFKLVRRGDHLMACFKYLARHIEEHRPELVEKAAENADPIYASLVRLHAETVNLEEAERRASREQYERERAAEIEEATAQPLAGWTAGADECWYE